MSATFGFSDTPSGPTDPMLALKVRADGDNDPAKVDLGVGVYRSQEGGCYELAAIRRAKEVLAKADLGHDYQPTTGIPAFLNNARKLVFGPICQESSSKIASVQTISGTGACHIGAMFAKHFYSNPTAPVYVGTPAWSNYKPLFELAQIPIVEYSAYNATANVVDFPAVISAVREAPSGGIFVLQACCANPTGSDFTREQWTQIADEFKSKGHLPFFDIAYQGFGDGLEDDAWAIREFLRRGFEMIVCQSFSKNMGLYGERVGALHVVTKSEKIATNVVGQLGCLIRWEFSSSPGFGARIANIIMNSEELTQDWTQELESMRRRLIDNRVKLHMLLTCKYKTPRSWENILRDKGLFSLLPLSPDEVDVLAVKHHIYLPPNGRINFAGLNVMNIERVAEVFDQTVRGRPIANGH